MQIFNLLSFSKLKLF